MSLFVYPRRPQERWPEPMAPRSTSDQGPARSAQTNPDRILVGLLAGVVLFYLLGKAIGLGRDPTED